MRPQVLPEQAIREGLPTERTKTGPWGWGDNGSLVHMVILPGPKEKEVGEGGVAGALGENPENRRGTGGLFGSLTYANIFQGWQQSGRTLPASKQYYSKVRSRLGPCRLRPTSWLCHSSPVLPQARDFISLNHVFLIYKMEAITEPSLQGCLEY